MNELSYEVVDTHPNPDSAVVWLHGLGANGHDFVPIVPELALPSNVKVRFIFPHATSIPVTVNGGAVMPAWYDILSMSIEREIDIDQIQESSKRIHHILNNLITEGMDSKKIILAGFSQGGAVAYESALSFCKPLAGLMAMSTYFATEETLVESPENKNIPLHIFHGTQDTVVPEQLGLSAVRDLKQRGYGVEYSQYTMAHSLCAEQIKDISSFIQKCFN